MLTEPLQHQRIIAEHTAGRQCSFNFGQQGTGKTWNALQLIEQLWRKHPDLKPLVVCLKGNMKGVWAPEALKHAGIDCTIIEGSAAKRAKLLKETSTLRVINYHGVKIPKVLEALEQDSLAPGLVVYDECFTIQNPKRFTKKGTPTLFGAAHKLKEISPRIHGMTGTPHGNNPLSLWAQCYAVDGGETFGSNFFAWRAQNFLEDSSFGWKEYIPKPGYRSEMNRRLYHRPGHAIRYLKSDCLDLPPKVYQTLFVEMPKETLKQYRAMEHEFFVETGEGVCATQSGGVKSLRLREICNGFLRGKQDPDDPTEKTKVIWNAANNPKQAALKMALQDLCNDGGQAIIWHCFLPDQNDIVGVCRDLGIKGTCLVGGMRTDEVADICKKFNEGHYQVVVASLAFKGVTHGANMQAAHAAIFYSNTWSLPDREQAEDRCHRFGSQRHNSITYVDIVCAGSVEEQVADALQRKAASAEIVVDGHKMNVGLGGSF